MDEVFHFQLHRVSFVVFSTLELLIAIFPCKTRHRPLVGRLPIFGASLNDNGLVWTLEAFDKLFLRDVINIDPINIVSYISWVKVEDFVVSIAIPRSLLMS